MSRWWLGLLAVLAATAVIAVGLVSLHTGPEWVEPGAVFDILTGGSARSSSGDPQDFHIIWNIRLPRILLAALVGSGLAVSGAAYQGLFRNPLADPFLIGASAGASLGATLAIVAKVNLPLLGFSPVPAAAFLGACLAVFLVWTIATAGGGAFPVLTLLLAGIAVSSFLGALVSLLLILFEPENFNRVFVWLTGNLPKYAWPAVQQSVVYLLAGGLGLLLFARPLDALALGEESAAALGIPTWRARVGILFFATLTTAAAVAVSGLIAFVGLIAPHAARLCVGPRHWLLLPASGVMGALLLMLGDMVARTALRTELPVGLVTSLLGGPFFLYLLTRRRGNLLRV